MFRGRLKEGNEAKCSLPSVDSVARDEVLIAAIYVAVGTRAHKDNVRRGQMAPVACMSRINASASDVWAMRALR